MSVSSLDTTLPEPSLKVKDVIAERLCYRYLRDDMDAVNQSYIMASKEEIKEMQDAHRQLEEEDKNFSAQLLTMEEEFTKTYQLTREDFNQMYAEGTKNFRLDFGTVCERGRTEVVEKLQSGKDKKRAVDEYLACVELTRQKAAQRAQQAD